MAQIKHSYVYPFALSAFKIIYYSKKNSLIVLFIDSLSTIAIIRIYISLLGFLFEKSIQIHVVPRPLSFSSISNGIEEDGTFRPLFCGVLSFYDKLIFSKKDYTQKTQNTYHSQTYSSTEIDPIGYRYTVCTTIHSKIHLYHYTTLSLPDYLCEEIFPRFYAFLVMFPYCLSA